MERITSRKNRIIGHLRSLGGDGAYRREAGEFLCDGEKLLREALASGAELLHVLWTEEAALPLPQGVRQYVCPRELAQYASPLKNSAGPVFSVGLRRLEPKKPLSSAIVLENVQDPGNVGTVIRTAAAMGMGAVILVGDCADPFGPKAVRSTMGAVFRQPVLEMGVEELGDFLAERDIKLCGAALSEGAADIRTVEARGIAVAIGSEGRGLSPELLERCSGRLKIPMEPGSESLNAAVAASIAMWEIYRKTREV